jgi:hypothetical protein
VNYAPPDEVRANAARGLVLVSEGRGGKGLKPATVRQARRIADGRGLDYDEAKVNLAWFARFGAYTAAVAARRRDPQCPAAVSWLLHGGDEGWEWVREIVEIDFPLPQRGP